MRAQPGRQYPAEYKEAIIERMMPPNNESIKALSEETGVTTTTLYKWRRASRANGVATPGDGQVSEKWNSEDKFLIVMETYSMNQVELAEYCRKKGLYKEQIEVWRSACLQANGLGSDQSKQINQGLKEEKKRAKTLEQDLRKKEKALAEAAALLLLRKKAQAVWGDPEEE